VDQRDDGGLMNLRCDSSEFTQDNTWATADDSAPTYVPPQQMALEATREGGGGYQVNKPNIVVGANWYP
jgi:hypothetical protein